MKTRAHIFTISWKLESTIELYLSVLYVEIETHVNDHSSTAVNKFRVSVDGNLRYVPPSYRTLGYP